MNLAIGGLRTACSFHEPVFALELTCGDCQGDGAIAIFQIQDPKCHLRCSLRIRLRTIQFGNKARRYDIVKSSAYTPAAPR